MRNVEDGRGARELSALWPWTVGALGLLLAWDASGLDLRMAHLMANGRGFVLQDSWAAGVLLHQGGRIVAYAFAAWLAVGIWWPTGLLRRLTRAARAQWLVSPLLGIAFVNLLKHSSLTSCPWDLAEFGGAGSYLTHWAWGRGDGGPGHCFPAGHASAGFAFLGGFFALRSVSSRAAGWCLAAVLAAGVVLGVAQQLRGAHFMSHTLWTAWVCWVIAWLVDTAGRFARRENDGILAFNEIS